MQPKHASTTTIPKIDDAIAEKARVEAIRGNILKHGTAHPEDVSWVAAEAYRLHVVRENAAKRLKALHETVAKYAAIEEWLKGVATFNMEDARDGGDHAELAGGWHEEAKTMLDGLQSTSEVAMGRRWSYDEHKDINDRHDPDDMFFAFTDHRTDEVAFNLMDCDADVAKLVYDILNANSRLEE